MLGLFDARPGRTPVAAGLLIAVVAGCTPGVLSNDDEQTRSSISPQGSVTVPAERLTPFCQAMIELADRLESDPPDDVELLILSTYESIADQVPDEIRVDFEAVVADLRGVSVPSGEALVEDESAGGVSSRSTLPPTTDVTGATLPQDDPLPDEGFAPEDDPALRLNAYVDFSCRDVANNPGPAATQPLSEPRTG